MVGQIGVVMDPGMAVRIGVHGDGGESRHGVGELVFGVSGDFVGDDEAQVTERRRHPNAQETTGEQRAAGEDNDEQPAPSATHFSRACLRWSTLRHQVLS
ncbi:hypothetical protein ABGB16_22145 [Micromonospora sp. B11E3]